MWRESCCGGGGGGRALCERVNSVVLLRKPHFKPRGKNQAQGQVKRNFAARRRHTLFCANFGPCLPACPCCSSLRSHSPVSHVSSMGSGEGEIALFDLMQHTPLSGPMICHCNTQKNVIIDAPITADLLLSPSGCVCLPACHVRAGPRSQKTCALTHRLWSALFWGFAGDTPFRRRRRRMSHLLHRRGAQPGEDDVASAPTTLFRHRGNSLPCAESPLEDREAHIGSVVLPFCVVLHAHAHACDMAWNVLFRRPEHAPHKS